MTKPFKRPTGATIFAWGLIISSLIHMHKLSFDYSWYMDTYSGWGFWGYVRYGFSWLQRFAGMAVGIGLLNRIDAARLGGMALGLFTIATVYWKHPYGPFKKHAQYLDREYSDLIVSLNVPGLTFESVTMIAVILHIVLDVAFWAVFIFYMTRTGVKEYFTKPHA